LGVVSTPRGPAEKVGLFVRRLSEIKSAGDERAQRTIKTAEPQRVRRQNEIALRSRVKSLLKKFRRTPLAQPPLDSAEAM
jgi:ribosomal protein S20